MLSKMISLNLHLVPFNSEETFILCNEKYNLPSNKYRIFNKSWGSYDGYIQ